jgi:flagellar basal body rod protein FlgG
MNVGLYSGAAGMRVGQDYQDMVTENLALQTVPGARQSLAVFSTDTTLSSAGSPTTSGNPAAIHMTRVTDFSQGPIEPSTSPYHVAIEGKSFFQVRELDGTTSYTRNGSFSVSPQGQLVTTDGASVLGTGGSALTLPPATASQGTIASDGTISIGGVSVGKLGFAHFSSPSAQLQGAAFGRYAAIKQGDAQDGMAPGDQVMSRSLEGSNANPVQQMADMIQAVRLYEANQKSIQAVDDNTNQLITTVGAHAPS